MINADDPAFFHLRKKVLDTIIMLFYHIIMLVI
ncbi:hypothetical protein Desca_1749 [Desulfotomaculum nigrificans CO-1-SRB]|uniref:Uncharacterized protein n=1 Tax=Desulfotomaculum nigrificans (strain DSM 14880 / VKM B-2319 / CO-1-SRB) TaxID=868595 RepID=F6B7V9_DESCC|nr:hypothetical protein Desca_1749 [Desulfotomaculum nigrificans CO-1-SRB]